MEFLKFKIIGIAMLCIGSIMVQAAPSVEECFAQDFSLMVKHKAKPFGLFESILSVNKEKCVITVNTIKYKYLKKRWVIDVCREPIHIKYGVNSVDVLKRKGKCHDTKTPFCKNFTKLIQIIEDDGLIFAAGNRNNITSEHGEVYCVFRLIKKYLNKGQVLGEWDSNRTVRSFEKNEEREVKK
jgi:hypothetical protein